MWTALIVSIHVFLCFFLIAVILLQAGRGQGLSWGVFGGNPQSIFGTKTASFLTKLTSGCAIAFLFTCISLNIIETRKSKSLLEPITRSQVDLERIKKALDEAQQSNTEESPAQSEQPADPQTQPPAQTAAAAPVPAPVNPPDQAAGDQTPEAKKN